MWFLNYSNLIDPLLKDIRIRALKFSGIKDGDKVLDVCCGTGDQIFHYLKKDIVAYGIDLEPSMIKIAKRNKKKLGLSNVSFQVADAQNLPFENGFFDSVSISFGLHEKERKTRDRIVSEMKRVAKKEGGLIFIDYRVPLPKTYISYLIKGVEYLAGREHFRYFKDYLEQGGLNVILKKNRLRVEKRDYAMGRIIEMIKTRGQSSF